MEQGSLQAGLEDPLPTPEGGLRRKSDPADRIWQLK